ncbi:MAG TPA: type II secretion system secretin GspD [Candidatus Acidoferrales bacterium]|nr:type II secretion system secretin GspD [Bryobacteraceae bacterium]HTS67309.1 type II secretion system secretin GspD [Candidatus Acidoferrales bacterium]
MRTLLTPLQLTLAAAAAATVLAGQVIAPSRPPTVIDTPQGQQQPAQPGQPPQPAQPGQAGNPAQTNAPASNAPRLDQPGALRLTNVSLTELIDILAKQLKINYILDPAVKGSVTVYTYGEVKPIDLMQLLETVLRVNGMAMVKVGDLYRIVPVARINQLPLTPNVNLEGKTLPDDERVILNLIFLKYTSATEIANLVKPFLGEGATLSVYEPANLIIMQDNARSMKRTMDLIALFDSDQLAGQRVRLFEIENSRPSDIQKELDSVFKSYALSDKNQSVKFIAVDRINTLIAVAPNPGIFAKVEEWIKKLDVAVKTSAGQVNSYVYRLKYARSETIAMAIMALYSNNPMALVMLASMAQMNNQVNGGAYGQNGLMNGNGYGSPYGMAGGGMGAMGMMGMMGVGGMGLAGMYPGMYPGTNYASYGYMPPMGTSPIAPQAGTTQTNPADAGLTGQYLGYPSYGMQTPGPRIPHVIPNPFDNTVLIQATPQEYEQILGLLRQLDVAPRQVLIDAKIYEVELTGAFSAGVSSFLQQKDTGSRILNITTGAAGLTLNTGALVLRSHELLAAITAAENNTHTRVISAPSIIATDSIAASLNVGEDVPVLTSQAVTGGVQQSGSSLFTNTVSNRSTGVTLSILARVNSSGIVTLVINQNVSSPEAPAAGGIQSPSFSNRSFQTQLTVQDGDTIAIGGIIQESNLQSSAGIPVLHRLPIVGPVFGTKSVSKSRTELVVFLTPRVIYDANQMLEATDEIKSGMKRIQALSKDQ